MTCLRALLRLQRGVHVHPRSRIRTAGWRICAITLSSGTLVTGVHALDRLLPCVDPVQSLLT